MKFKKVIWIKRDTPWLYGEGWIGMIGDKVLFSVTDYRSKNIKQVRWDTFSKMGELSISKYLDTTLNLDEAKKIAEQNFKAEIMGLMEGDDNEVHIN